MKYAIFCMVLCAMFLLNGCSGSGEENQTDEAIEPNAVEAESSEGVTETEDVAEEEEEGKFPVMQWANNIIIGKGEETINEDTIEVTTEFYPLGFSEDGNMAYIKHAIGQTPLGDNSWSFEVQNLVTDDNLLFKYWEEDEDPDFSELLVIQEETIDEGLTKFSINRYQNSKLSEFPITIADDVVDAACETNAHTVDEEFGGYKHTITITSEKMGSKTISEIETLVENCEIVGYVKSPFEDRVAVIVKTTGIQVSIGLMVNFHITGAHLTAGFR